MRKAKTFLVTLVAVFSVGSIGAGAAGATAGNHGQISIDMGLGSQTCSLVFGKSLWNKITPQSNPSMWSSDLSNLTGASPCAPEVAAVSGNGVRVVKSDYPSPVADSFLLSGDVTFSIYAVLGVITCTWSLDGVEGTWVQHAEVPGPPTVAAWEEFSIDDSSVAMLDSGSFLCPDPLDIVNTVADPSFLHTDVL